MVRGPLVSWHVSGNLLDTIASLASRLSPDALRIRAFSRAADDSSQSAGRDGSSTDLTERVTRTEEDWPGHRFLI